MYLEMKLLSPGGEGQGQETDVHTAAGLCWQGPSMTWTLSKSAVPAAPPSQISISRMTKVYPAGITNCRPYQRQVPSDTTGATGCPATDPKHG
jgi:hypothetical protein